MEVNIEVISIILKPRIFGGEELLGFFSPFFFVVDYYGLKIFHIRRSVKNNVAVFKADFYDDESIIAVSPKGSQIRSLGTTVVKYQNKIFNSISELIKEFGNNVINSFDEWQFIEEKEWVVFKNGEWMYSFTTLDKLPKTTKLRC